jgi:opacity protein-like surface antigen
MRLLAFLAVAVVLAIGLVTAAAAKTCKEPIIVTSRSTIEGGELARTKRATDNSQKKWSKQARAKYGLQYQFWLRADAKTVDCHQTPKSTVCKATATPCSLL